MASIIMRFPPPFTFHLPLSTIFPCLVLVYGAATLAAQILFLREFLVLAQGNELQLGIGLWAWLVWTGLGSLAGGRLSASRPLSPPTLAWLLLGLAWALPATVLAARALPTLLGLLPGQELLPRQAALFFLGLSAPFGLLSGLFFPLACQTRHSSPERGTVGRIYFLDTLGATLGGSLLQLGLMGRFSGLSICLGISLSLILTTMISSIGRPPSAGQARGASPKHEKNAGRREIGDRRRDFFTSVLRLPSPVSQHLALPLISGLSLILVAALLWLSPRLEDWSRQWQWPGHQRPVIWESPYSLLTATRQAEQVSFFINKLWDFSYPDPLKAEEKVHLALLQHPAPQRVLLVGGGVAGLAAEILETPTLVRLDYVELDPGLLSLAREVLPSGATQVLSDPRVRLIHQDGRHFLQKTSNRYDVILLGLPEPKNVLLNRFYTLEFFRIIKERLHPGGVFSFSLTGFATSPSPGRVQYLALAYNTLRQVFSEVIIFPGDAVRFFAGPPPGGLVSDPAVLISRLQERQLPVYYLREDYLQDQLAVARQDYLRRILTQAPVALNTDLNPQCFFYDLVLSLGQEGMGAMHWFLRLSRLPFWALLLGLAGLTGLWCFCRRSRGEPRSGPYLYNMLVMGMSVMSLELITIILFQIQLGSAYSQMGLLITAFMLGMAGGSYLAPRLTPDFAGTRRLSLICQSGLFVITGVSGIWLPTLAHLPGLGREGWGQLIFMLFLLVVGGLGGGLFASLAEALRYTGTRLGTGAGVLYAVDLLGATLGTLGMSLLALPIFGLRPTLVLLAALHLSAMTVLVSSRFSRLSH